jgi:hypothetical protein
VKQRGGIPTKSQPEASLAWRGARTSASSSTLADPFAVNPIRRSSTLVVVCAATIFIPWLISEELATTVMLSVGWLAMTGIVIGVPVLILSLIEELVSVARRRLRPPVQQLDISPRVAHVLLRHGYDSIDMVDRAPDAALLLLSNMDVRGVREIRRAISVWKYRRWQDRGFPITGLE